jgi:ribonuclease PH
MLSGLPIAKGGERIELQGTAEKAPFPREQLNTLLDLTAGGIAQLAAAQLTALEER